MTGPSDSELIDRTVQHGDRNAFGELVRRHQSPVRNLLRRLTCGDISRSDDLSQETFIKAYTALGGFRSQARFSTWLYRIAYHAFLADVRSNACKNNTLDKVTRLDGDRPKTDTMGGDLRIDLDRAMAQLSEAERAAIALCYGRGLSHGEAADVMDCPVGTVKTQVLRGKQKLRVLLDARTNEVRDGDAQPDRLAR